MFEAMLKSMGFDPEDFKKKFTRAMELVDTFDQRLKDIDVKLDVIYGIKKTVNSVCNNDSISKPEPSGTNEYFGGPLV